ncbi:MAG: DUF6624 domain-containing protein [Acidobacteriota bacterium]
MCIRGLSRWIYIAGFFFLTTINGIAIGLQAGTPLERQAYTAYENKRYTECFELNQAIIVKGAAVHTTYYSAACCLALAGRIDTAFQYLYMAIEKGYFNFEHMQKDTDLAALRADARWAEVAGKCQEAQAKLNMPLREELRKMALEDQKVRNKINGPNIEASLKEEMQNIDTKNTARMHEIIKEYGWPARSLVGYEGANAAWLLIQHADRDPEFQRECLALMKTAVEKGEASGIHFALLTDRVLVNQGKKQIYGTQFKYLDGELVPSPLEDPDNVDRRRQEIGLEPLEEYKNSLKEVYGEKKK